MKRMSLTFSLLLLAAISLQAEEKENVCQKDPPWVLLSQLKKPSPIRLRRTTAQMREQAAARKKAVFKATPPGPGDKPNYFGPEPNYANSPLPIIQTKHGKLQVTSGIRKFVDSLPGLGIENQNNLGQFIPVAVPDTTTWDGNDYYEIGLIQHEQQLHSDLGNTTLRGYVQTNAPLHPSPQYLGPLFIARKGRPIRLKFSNLLPTGTAGNLFLPVDTTIMGAGMGPLGGMYTQNRAIIHLHGGDTPWISDGTPHQWITPAGELTLYPRGVSSINVPDMPDPGAGASTLYYPNGQSARMLWYHDHAYGITRLNVYAGEAGGFLLTDDVEEGLIYNHILPDLGGSYHWGIPLIIQDKTFVPPHDQLVNEDPTWNYNTTSGSLWFPHVYMTNQNPSDPMGVNAMGRWDYGPWFWPLFNNGAGIPLDHLPSIDPSTGQWNIPLPYPSLVPESFMDTPVVNGTAYPYLDVDRKPYRFRILNACNDRYLNLQLYYAEPLSVSIVDGGSGYKEPPKVKFEGGKHTAKGDHFKPAKGKAIIQNGQVVAVEVTDPGKGYKSAPKVIFENSEKGGHGAKATASINTEVKMISASPDSQVPPFYPMMDGRAGGVPDPENAGPSMIQIANEGGFLPAPVVLPNTPIGYVYNRRDITVLNVQEKTLFLGPAERGDVIIDFSGVPKHVSTIILYNDAPAPVPGFDPRVDYYTSDPDQTSTGGAPSTLAGYGPNTRTIMQFRLSDKKGEHFNLEALQTALPLAYLASQAAPIVPETAYPGEFHADSNTYAKLQDDSLTFIPVYPVGATGTVTISMEPKAIAEEFELNYARMNAVLGSELPFTNAGNQTTVLLNYIDPPVEFVGDDQAQIWRVTHNGVDTHAIHTHLFNMQVINRVGWDGMIKPPDPNELGWKDTVRMNPLENAIVAIRPKRPPHVPFDIPNSIRLLDPSMPDTSSFNSFDPYTGTAVTWENTLHNFGWEYIWHCHLLGHEENDMMRPVAFCAVPSAPGVTIGTISGFDVPITVTPPPVVPPDAPALDHYEVTVTEPGPVTTTPPAGFLSGWVVNIPASTTMPYTITVHQSGPYVFRVNAVYKAPPSTLEMLSLPTIVNPVNVTGP